MGLISGFVRFLAVLLIVRLVLRSFASLVPATRPTSPGAPRTPGAIDLVRDPVCNTFLPRSRAVQATIGGREQLFCSADCARRAQLT